MMRADDVRRAAVIGAGIMGHSIAQVFAQAGIETSLVDVSEETLGKATEKIAANLAVLADSGLAKREDVEGIIGRVHPSTDLADSAADADFVLEAVPEVPEIKKEVFAQLGGACHADVVIASNTSGLDIFEFAEVANPERLVIAHWFAPPHVIPLVEVVPGPATVPETVDFTMSLMERLGKVPVRLQAFTRAFIVNKIQNMIALAVSDLLNSGTATPEDIDKAVKYSLGIRLPIVGVVQTMDFTGLDLVLDIARSYGMGNAIIEEKVEKGYLGAKTSRGFYDYGGRSELEIVEKRDRLYLKMLERLREMNAFDPV
ncbi:MAG: 3-hydroxyacyl-CoA dehydrogenase family protein [Actinomycetota bacterium]